MGVPSGGIVVRLYGRPEDDGLVCGVHKIYVIWISVKERANDVVDAVLSDRVFRDS